MSAKILLFPCGPSSEKCRCECTSKHRLCEHCWDGKFIHHEHGGTATCSRCGMWAENHDIWVSWGSAGDPGEWA